MDVRINSIIASIGSIKITLLHCHSVVLDASDAYTLGPRLHLDLPFIPSNDLLHWLNVFLESLPQPTSVELVHGAPRPGNPTTDLYPTA